MRNNQMQKGFTLIELIMIIVILGVLAVTAIPKYLDLKDDAEKASVKGVAGALASAAAINYAGCVTTNNVVTTNKCVKVSACSDVGALVKPAMTINATDSFTTYYLSADTAAATNGLDGDCKLSKDKTTAGDEFYNATYNVIGAGN